MSDGPCSAAYSPAPNTGELVHRYCTLYPGIEQDPDDLLGALPRDADHEAIKSLILGRADIDIDTLFIFDAHDIAQNLGLLGGCNPIDIGRAVDLSRALDHAEIEKFFLNNPVWTAPFINVSGQYFIPVPQLLFAYIHRIVHSLANDPGLERETTTEESALS